MSAEARDKLLFEYDVALSFAGEDRAEAERLAAFLKKEGVRVFYDDYEKDQLWGADLYQHLASVYQDRSRFCVVILSAAYANKLWTKHELQNAQARAFRESQEYILPLRKDDTSIPGIAETIGYIDLRETSLDEVAKLVLRKLEVPTVDAWHNIIEKHTLPEVKCSLDVRIEKPVSKSELERLAIQLYEEYDGSTFERMFVCYFLPGMELNAGVWASTHFNPDLDVRILGISTEQAAALSRPFQPAEGQIVGRWLEQGPGFSRRLTIYRESNRAFMHEHFRDGSERTVELSESTCERGIRFVEKDDRGHGEFWILDKSGYLSLWGPDGKALTYLIG